MNNHGGAVVIYRLSSQAYGVEQVFVSTDDPPSHRPFVKCRDLYTRPGWFASWSRHTVDHDTFCKSQLASRKQLQGLILQIVDQIIYRPPSQAYGVEQVFVSTDDPDVLSALSDPSRSTLPSGNSIR